MSQSTTLRIIGMTCGACVRRVESALEQVPGTPRSLVNLLSETAVVEVPSGVTTATLIEAVRNAGYDAEVLPSGRDLLNRMADSRANREQLRRHRQGLIQAVGLALPIMALDHGMHLLWGHTFERQVAARYMQLILLVMMSVSPGVAPILIGGLRALVKRAGNMDLLVTIGVLTALASSLWGVFVARNPAFIHIDAASMILALVCIGRFLETRAKQRAVSAMTDLAASAPRDALVLKGEEWTRMPVERIEVGDSVTVPAHEPVPVDGEIEEGAAAVDESLMTGEPLPVRRTRGDRLLGGTKVVEGQVTLRATATGARSAVGRIIESVNAAQASRTEAQRMADRVAGVFVPIVILIAAVTFAGWRVLGGMDHSAEAIRAAAAVLVVACPCALGLATPTVVTVAIGVAARKGILVRDAATLEAAGSLSRIIWDKTGTLTSGLPIVTDFSVVDGFEASDVLKLAAAAEQFSSHPLAGAITAEARRKGLTLPEPTEFEVTPGVGVRARVEGRDVRVGKFDSNEEPPFNEGPIPEAGATYVRVRIDGQIAATISLRDSVRPAARVAIETLSALGVVSEMLTGDRVETATAIAGELGLAASAVTANVLPDGKVAHVRRRIAEQATALRRPAPSGAVRRANALVGMVGDGINDAAALAAADVGIAFATGAQLACDAAGIQLVGSSPQLVVDAVSLARSARRIIRQNLFWAFSYNVLMIPLAALGNLPPALAAGAMMVSSLTVVMNALRLRTGSTKLSLARKKTTLILIN